MAGRKRVIAIGLCVLAVAVTAIAWLHAPAPADAILAPVTGSSAPIERTSIAVDDLRPDATTRAPPAMHSVAVLEPLVIPPDGELDATSLAELDRAARSGHALAACRLAAELERCAILQRTQRFPSANDVEALAEQTALGEAALQEEIERIADEERRIEKIAADCDVVAATLMVSAGDYLTLAASNGHAPSQIRYLSAQHLTTSALLQNPARLEHYRANARRFFDASLAAGDLRLLHIWLMSTQFPEHLPLRDFLPEQWRDPGIVAALIEQLDTPQREGAMLPAPAERILAPPTQAQRDAASRLYREHFAASPPPPRTKTPPSRGRMQKFSLETHFCDEAPR